MLKKSKDPGPSPSSVAQKSGATRAAADFPALNNVLTDTLTSNFDFAKNLWGGLPASIPGFIVPTMDIEELDKRITDLRAVESWLALNANLLRTTIQSLEVQRNTIAAIQSFGGSLGSLAQDLLQGKSNPAAGGFARARVPGAGPDAGDSARAPDEMAGARTRLTDPEGREEPSGRIEKPSGADPSDLFGAAGSAWLGFLEDQFNRVALSALSAGATGDPSSKTSPGERPLTPAQSRRTGKKSPAMQRAPRKSKG